MKSIDPNSDPIFFVVHAMGLNMDPNEKWIHIIEPYLVFLFGFCAVGILWDPLSSIVHKFPYKL